jgi:cytochrome c oxidase cbb3-type subunit 3
MFLPFRNLRCFFGLALAASLTLGACDREKRDFNGPPPKETKGGISPTSLAAGGVARPPPKDSRAAIYENNAYHISQGKLWYDRYNCYGCHAGGGGGDIGPPLIDDEWLYGGSMEQIYATITEGRPNGMPAFGAKLTDSQTWELAAYIRALGGNVRKDAVPARGDELKTGDPLTQIPPTPTRAVSPADHR